ncbi:MAG TPA: DUF3566 domain-containing protein [Nocardioides sp.]|jgi:hypothetical protein|nr:DUF3566 domain-containing protein [Nocardioides sp.]
MTERSAEQAPVQTRPQDQESHQDTARIPLAERLQRRISAAADDRRATAEAPREPAPRDTSGPSNRVLPPMPAELRGEPRPAPQAAPRTEPQTRSVQAVPDPVSPEQTAAVPVARPTAAPRRTTAPSRAPRRARLRLSRVDPWSVMKVSFLLSIAFGIVTVVSVFMVWSVLSAAGVWSSINNTVSDTVSSPDNLSTFNIEDYLGMSRVLGFTMLVSVIDVILITAIATLGAFLYNMAASLLGGIEVTLSEDN